MPSLLVLLIIFSIFRPQWDALSLAISGPNDFSYMKVVSNATDLPLNVTYDYIIVGGGTAGCPLAATLSQNFTVLVLERGSTPQAYPSVLRVENLVANIEADDDGKNPVERFTSMDGVENARGRILGGSSMINAGFYSRAEPEFFQKSRLNWDMNRANSSYQWVEDIIVYRSDPLPYQVALKNASLEAGIVPDNGFTLEHLLGTKYSGSIFDDMGRRHGAVELLNKGDLNWKLRVVVGATVEKILLSTPIRSSGLGATGVRYRDSRGTVHYANIRPKGEVILSAGALGSPQLLLLSGVGPTSDLSSYHIPVKRSQPNVGKFMADNPRNSITIVAPFSLPPSYAQVVAITRELYIESISGTSQFMWLNKPSSLLRNLTSPIDLDLAFLGSKVPGPSSTDGFLTLDSSTNASVSPKVRFNYFSNLSDLAVCVKGVRKVGDLLSTRVFKPYKFDNRDVQGTDGFKYFGPPLPANYATNDTGLENFCRTTITTWWHFHGGCTAGKVVDGDFKVIGVNALRVVDGSVFTSSPGSNPQATLMMMGRYVGLKILQQRMT